MVISNHNCITAGFLTSSSLNKIQKQVIDQLNISICMCLLFITTPPKHDPVVYYFSKNHIKMLNVDSIKTLTLLLIILTFSACNAWLTPTYFTSVSLCLFFFLTFILHVLAHFSFSLQYYVLYMSHPANSLPIFHLLPPPDYNANYCTQRLFDCCFIIDLQYWFFH